MLVIVGCSSNTVEDGKIVSCENYSKTVCKSYVTDEFFYGEVSVTPIGNKHSSKNVLSRGRFLYLPKKRPNLLTKHRQYDKITSDI